jgi:hypothetical protein
MRVPRIDEKALSGFSGFCRAFNEGLDLMDRPGQLAEQSGLLLVGYRVIKYGVPGKGYLG